MSEKIKPPDPASKVDVDRKVCKQLDDLHAGYERMISLARTPEERVFLIRSIDLASDLESTLTHHAQSLIEDLRVAAGDLAHLVCEQTVKEIVAVRHLIYTIEDRTVAQRYAKSFDLIYDPAAPSGRPKRAKATPILR